MIICIWYAYDHMIIHIISIPDVELASWWSWSDAPRQQWASVWAGRCRSSLSLVGIQIQQSQLRPKLWISMDFYGFLWISMGFFSPSLIAVFKVQGHIGPERVVGGKAVCSTGRAIGRQWAMVWTDGGVSVWRWLCTFVIYMYLDVYIEIYLYA